MTEAGSGSFSFKLHKLLDKVIGPHHHFRLARCHHRYKSFISQQESGFNTRLYEVYWPVFYRIPGYFTNDIIYSISIFLSKI